MQQSQLCVRASTRECDTPVLHMRVREYIVLTSIHIFPLFLFFSLFQFYSHPSAGKNSEHEEKNLTSEVSLETYHRKYNVSGRKVKPMELNEL